MIIARVIPISPGIPHPELSYISNVHMNEGTLVSVPLNKRTIKGLVIETNHIKDLKQDIRKQNYTLKKITEIHEHSMFSSAFISSVKNIAEYYLVPAGKLLAQLSPSFLDGYNYENTTVSPNAYQASAITGSTKHQLDKLVDLISHNETSIQIICPTKHAVNTLYGNLKNRGVHTTKMHSGIAKKKLRSIYETAPENTQIIISTIQYLDIPLCNKTHLVSFEDTSPYHRQMKSPHVDARLLSLEYAKGLNLHYIVMGNIIGSDRLFELQLEPKNIDLSSIEYISAYNKKELVQTDAERIADLSKKKDFNPFSKSFEEKLQSAIHAGKKIFIYCEKKSLAPHIVCQDCGGLATCTKTDIPYSLYQDPNNKDVYLFINNLTKEQRPAFDICQHCASWRLTPIGIGTQRIYDILKHKFSGVPIAIADGYHTKTDIQTKKVVSAFKEHQGASILIGTTKALPYIEKVDTSFSVSLESMLSRMNYMTEVQLFILLSKLADITNGKAYIQSRNALHKHTPELVTGDYERFHKRFLKDMESIKAPPFGTIIKISHEIPLSKLSSLQNLYQNALSGLQPDIVIRKSPKDQHRILGTIIHLDKSYWNINHQDKGITSLLPIDVPHATIEVNPEWM